MYEPNSLESFSTFLSFLVKYFHQHSIKDKKGIFKICRDSNSVCWQDPQDMTQRDNFTSFLYSNSQCNSLFQETPTLWSKAGYYRESYHKNKLLNCYGFKFKMDINNSNHPCCSWNHPQRGRRRGLQGLAMDFTDRLSLEVSITKIDCYNAMDSRLWDGQQHK